MKFGEEIDAFQRQQAEQPDEASERQKLRHLMKFDEKTLVRQRQRESDSRGNALAGKCGEGYVWLDF